MDEMLAVSVAKINYVKCLIFQSWDSITKCEILVSLVFPLRGASEVQDFQRYLTTNLLLTC